MFLADVAYDCLRVRAPHSDLGRELVVDSEIRPCQQERLAALHIEIGIIRHVDELSK